MESSSHLVPIGGIYAEMSFPLVNSTPFPMHCPMRISLSILLLTASCGLTTGEAIDFDNPFCQDVEVTFTASSSLTHWTHEVDFYNVIDEDYQLESITIKDADEHEAYSITLTAPDGCTFKYHRTSSVGGAELVETPTPTSLNYVGTNVKRETTVTSGGSVVSTEREYFCAEHLGTWSLEITYVASEIPSGAVTSYGALHKTYEICFEYEE